MKTNIKLIQKLELKAAQRRKEILEMIVGGKGTHIASAFSIIDILVYLYEKVLEINPQNFANPKRDRFILSKGHGGAALYVVLANHGFFPKDALKSYCSEGGILGGHPDRFQVPGVEVSTGSLGHGLSVAVGLALANKINKLYSKVYCLVGDGECNEGEIWEACMVAAHHKLDNLVLIVDNNKLMISGFTKDILDPISFPKKFKAFGWNTIEIDGHDFEKMIDIFQKVPIKNKRPTVIVANTVKGKGISYMENESRWHGMLPNEEQMKMALEELKNRSNLLKKNKK